MVDSTKPGWIPDNIWEFSVQILKQSNLGEDDRAIMHRLISCNDQNMKSAFASLANEIKDGEKQLLVFKKLWNLAISIEMLQPISQSEYKKYWEENANLAHKLADKIQEAPSPDLIMPIWHNDLLPLLKKVIDDFGISVPIEAFDPNSKKLKPYKSFPSLKQALISYAEMATKEAEKKPTYHTFNEVSVLPHNKIGKEKELGRQFFFVNGLKAIIKEETGKPLHQTVAYFTNVVFNLDSRWDSERVRKLDAPKN